MSGGDDVAGDDVLAEARRARAGGDLAGAFARLTAALARAEVDEVGLDRLAEYQFELGQVAAAFGDSTEARRWLSLADAATTDRVARARIELALGRLDAAAGMAGEARRRLRLALKGFEESGAAGDAARCHLELAELYIESGDLTIAQLECAACASLRGSDDVDDVIDALVVFARLRAAQGDVEKVRDDLSAAIDVATTRGSPRASELEAMLGAQEERLDGSVIRRRSAAALPPSSVQFVSIVVGADGDIGQAAVINSQDLDQANLASVGRFMGDLARDQRGFPVESVPRVEVAMIADESVFGLVYAFYFVRSDPCGFSIVATGATDDRERLSKSDAAVSFYAGRWRTDSYVGFGRHRAFRPGALSAVTERPVAFFVAYADVRHDIAQLCHERHLEIAAAWIAMIAEDGSSAHRIRELTDRRRMG